MQGSAQLISVVIPAYNRELTIAHTLDSLTLQSHEEWEAIVIDDGSSDATAELAEEYAQRDGRIRVYRQANGGVSAARNAGIARARHPWLFFLDADDWITPTAFAALLRAASSHPGEIDAVYAGYVRVDENGHETRERRPPHAEDLFPVFTQMCAFAIHACLVRTDLVRAAGGFDETLVTCEDWDLWQRIARAGARFAAIPDYIAYYGMRAKSASANGARMLDDGLKVIARGHTEDPRLTAVNPLHRLGAAGSARALAQVYFACYAAGLAMAWGDDARWMLEALENARPTGLDPAGVAETLFLAIPNGRASNPEEWAQFPSEIVERCDEFIDALGDWMGDKWLAFGARRSLERLKLNAVKTPKPRTVGAWHLMEVDCAGDPPQHLFTGPEVEHVVCSVRFASRELGTVELATCDGWVPPRVFADRVADALAWEILGALLARDVHPELEIERNGESVRVERNGLILAEGSPQGSRFEEWLRNHVDWTLLLQEVWERRAWLGEDFYSDRPEPRGTPRWASGGAPIAVELSAPLPTVYCRGEATIGATLAGIPLTTLRLKARRGRVRAHEIRKAVLTELGFELCRAVAREWILAPAAAPGTSLRAVFAAAAAHRSSGESAAPVWAKGSQPRTLVPGWSQALVELLPPGKVSLVIGRRATGADGTSASRYAVLPPASREEMLAAALQGEDPALEVGKGEPACVAYAPCVQWDRVTLELPSQAHRPSDKGQIRKREDGPSSLEAPKLPILMYHRIAATGSAETRRWRTHPDDFRRQLDFLRDADYYSLTFEQWRAAENTRRPLPGKPVILTFDDGYEDFYEEVAPLLADYGFRASVFIVSELVGQTNAWDAELGETLRLMDWPEIKALASEGFEIGSHTRCHLPLVTLDQGQLADDLARSKYTLEQQLGRTITGLSYPFGLHDSAVESVAGACGYEYAVTTDEWSASWSDSLLSLPRLEVHGTDTIDDFAAMLRR